MRASSLLSLMSMTDSDPDPTRTETQFRELRTQIHELLGRLDAAVDREAEAMGPRLKKAQERLHELRESSADAWHTIADVHVTGRVPGDDGASRFSPLRAGRGIRTVGFVAGIRRVAYAVGQAARPS